MKAHERVGFSCLLALSYSHCCECITEKKLQLIIVLKYLNTFNLLKIPSTLSDLSSRMNNAEEAEVEPFFEDLQDLLELTPPKKCSFHYRGLECKSRKSRNT